MSYMDGQSRDQMHFTSLDEQVAPDHMVRVIDKFCDILDFYALGFLRYRPAQTGRPGYDPRLMTSLYLYGSTIAVRSSRKLECLGHESLPAIWLLGGLRPDFKTISDFRKDNIKALENVFDEFVSFLAFAGLFAGKVCAVDGTKVRASNNKKANVSKKRVNARITSLRAQMSRWLEALDTADEVEAIEEAFDKAENISEALKRWEKIEADMGTKGVEELSLTDPDARLMAVRSGGCEVAYNIQASVDAKHNMVVAYDVINEPADTTQLLPMMQKTTETLRKREGLIGLADKGYYGAEQMLACEADGLDVIVARQKAPGDKGKELAFRHAGFKYDQECDCYICPADKKLKAHSAKDARRRRFFDRSTCTACPKRDKCLTGEKERKRGYRIINRNPNAEVLERSDAHFTKNRELYRLRQQVVEPVFGIIKSQLGLTSFLLRTLEKVPCEVAIALSAHNIKRCYNILGFDAMVAALDSFKEKFKDASIASATAKNLLVNTDETSLSLQCVIISLSPTLKAA
jgi:transposase